MATIRVRKRADGSVRYTAQIRIKRNGVQVYQETQSFVRKQAAQVWARRREAELNSLGAIERLCFSARLKDVASGDLSHLVLLNDNMPTAVPVGTDAYQALQDELEDMRSELLAIQRLPSLDTDVTVSLEAIEARFD
jgi:antitoxin StbD